MFLLSIFGKNRRSGRVNSGRTTSQHQPQRSLRPGDKELERLHVAAPESRSKSRHKDKRRWQDDQTDNTIRWQQQFIPPEKELEELHPALRTCVSFILRVDQIFEDLCVGQSLPIPQQDALVNPIGQGPDLQLSSHRLLSSLKRDAPDADKRESVLLFLASPRLDTSTFSHATTISCSPQAEESEVPPLPPRPGHLSSNTSVTSSRSTHIFSSTSSASHISSAELSRPGERLVWQCLMKKRALRPPPLEVKLWEDLISRSRGCQAQEMQAKMCGKPHRSDLRCKKMDNGWTCNGTKVFSLMLRSC